MEEDWLLRQIKLVGEGIGQLLKKQIDSVEFGEVQNENGDVISRKTMILTYLEAEKFEQAFLLVNSLKYKLSVYDFNCASKWFIDLLKNIQQQKPDKLNENIIERYSEILAQLM
ncbi:hypothetical protein ACYSNW_14620 [Enterococcus sp. LJL99]